MKLLLKKMSKSELITCLENSGYIKKPLRTEDTGKMLEMAICMVYDIPYQGKYKYDMVLPEALKPRLMRLTHLFPQCRHTAEKGSRYDYTCVSDNSLHLSAKSTKGKNGKVAPQVIGQASLKKFCEIMEIEFESVPKLKEYIQTHITDILSTMVKYTFDCVNLYYNQENDTIKYITLDSPINWNEYTFSWTRNWEEWKNSTTLKINNFSLVEFQIHTKSRKNLAIRWFYDSFLEIFKDHLTIINL
jgi:hypothetical protein